MYLSCFTPFGMLEFDSEPSEAEKAYDALLSGYRDPRTGKDVFDVTPGTHHERKIYANAMLLGGIKQALKQSKRERRPGTSYEMLPAHEDAYQVAPAANATITERQDAVALRARANRGSRYEALFDALATVLGTDFLTVRALSASEATSWPADPSLGPGVFPRPEVPTKTVRLIEPVTAAGAVAVAYEDWQGSKAAPSLQVGDELCVQPETDGVSEKVTVTAVSDDGTRRTFTATFARAHDEGCAATSGPMPIWWSTKRLLLIVVKAAASIDGEKLRVVDEVMARIARGVTQWAIVRPTSPGAKTIGPFTIGSSPLGAVTLGTITF